MNTKMKSTLAFLGATCAAATALAADRLELNGAGGSFPAPLYQKWCYAYTQAGLGAKVNYQSVGSSAGISQIKAGTVRRRLQVRRPRAVPHGLRRGRPGREPAGRR